MGASINIFIAFATLLVVANTESIPRPNWSAGYPGNLGNPGSAGNPENSDNCDNQYPSPGINYNDYYNNYYRTYYDNYFRNYYKNLGYNIDKPSDGSYAKRSSRSPRQNSRRNSPRLTNRYSNNPSYAYPRSDYSSCGCRGCNAYPFEQTGNQYYRDFDNRRPAPRYSGYPNDYAPYYPPQYNPHIPYNFPMSTEYETIHIAPVFYQNGNSNIDSPDAAASTESTEKGIFCGSDMSNAQINNGLF